MPPTSFLRSDGCRWVFQDSNDDSGSECEEYPGFASFRMFLSLGLTVVLIIWDSKSASSHSENARVPKGSQTITSLCRSIRDLRQLL